MHYGLVLLLIAVALVTFGPAVAISKGILLVMLLAGLVSLMAGICVSA